MTVVVVTLTLQNPAHKPNEESHLSVDLVFDKQPSVADVYQAFCATPTVYKRKDFPKYRAAALDGLETYGVPKLDQHRLVSEDRVRLAAPWLRANWYINIVGQDASTNPFEYGSITVALREVFHTATVPEAPATKPVGKPRAKARSTPKEQGQGQPYGGL
jgi:hypothetical protein